MTESAVSESPRLTYVSLGAGVQSSALLVMATLGLRGCPKANLAIFADTGDEPSWVYRQVETLQAWAAASGVPIVRVSAGHLSADLIARHSGRRTRFAAIPAFTSDKDGKATMLPRQCTSEYKLEPIAKEARRQLGFKARQRIPHGSAMALIGISIDEAGRMKPSRQPWITNRYPLVDAAMTRSACITVLEANGLPVPKKSACTLCPFHDNRYWRMLRDTEPLEFQRVVAIDAQVRDMSRSGIVRPVFLHRSLKPLGEVDFGDEAQASLFDGFQNECEGVCGV